MFIKNNTNIWSQVKKEPSKRVAPSRWLGGLMREAHPIQRVFFPFFSYTKRKIWTFFNRFVLFICIYKHSLLWQQNEMRMHLTNLDFSHHWKFLI